MVLIIRKEKIEAFEDEKVSVPLRGLWFLSKAGERERKIKYFVSVPLRGLWFLSILFAQEICFSEPCKFPSPCGDYGSYRTRTKNKIF